MKIWNKILTYRKPKLHLVPKFCQLLQRIFCCQNSEYIWNIKGMERYRNLVSSITTMTPLHTVAIWIFTFHKKSGFVRVILKTNFNSTYRPNPLLFLAGNSDILHSIFIYFLQNLSNPLLLFQRFDAKMATQICQLFEIAATVYKKQWIWQILQTIEKKWA